MKDFGPKKIAISLFLCFHLLGVIFLPNLSSYTGQFISKIYLPYMNGLGLGGAWSFFAPEPFSPPMYVDYTLEMKDAISVSGRFPDEQEYFFFRSPKNRRGSLTRFILSEDKHSEFMFMNYICHKVPEATSAKLWLVRGTQPDFNMVREQGVPMSKTVDYKSQFIGEYPCKRGSS